MKTTTGALSKSCGFPGTDKVREDAFGFYFEIDTKKFHKPIKVKKGKIVHFKDELVGIVPTIRKTKNGDTVVVFSNRATFEDFYKEQVRHIRDKKK